MDELAAAAAVLAMEVDSDGGDGLGLDAPAGGFANDLLQPTTFEVLDMDLRSQRGDAARCEVEDANTQVITASQSMLNTPCAQHLTPCYSNTCVLPDVCATGLS
jgi:hypothetical protein